MNVSSPAIVDGDLIVGAGLPGQFIVRLNGTTGAVVWQSAPVLEVFSNTPPAVAGGLVVVGTNGGHYYAFDASTGAARWDYRADGIVNIASPLIEGGRVYLAGGKESDHVHAVDANTGAAIAGWPVSLPAPAPDLDGRPIYRRRAVSSFASAGGLVTLETRLDDALDTDGDGLPDHYLARESVIALDPTSGAVVWQRALGHIGLHRLERRLEASVPARRLPLFRDPRGHAAPRGGVVAGGPREPSRGPKRRGRRRPDGGWAHAGVAGDVERSNHHGGRERDRGGAAVVGQPPAGDARAGGEPPSARCGGRDVGLVGGDGSRR